MIAGLSLRRLKRRISIDAISFLNIWKGHINNYGNKRIDLKNFRFGEPYTAAAGTKRATGITHTIVLSVF